MISDQYTPYGAGKIKGAAEERERIIRIISIESNHDFVDETCDCTFCNIVWLINDRNVL